MKLDLHLADAASVDDRSKVYTLGLGWTVTSSPTPAIAVLLLIELDAADVPADLTFRLELRDSTGQLAHFPASNSEEIGRPVFAVGHIEAPPLPTDFPGDPLRVPLVVNISPGIALEPGTKYGFYATVTRDGEPLDAVQIFRVRFPDETQTPGIPVQALLQGNTERAQIEIAASTLGFQVSRDISTSTGTYERANRVVRVRYDRAGNVLAIQVEDQEPAPPPTLQAALQALQVSAAEGKNVASQSNSAVSQAPRGANFEIAKDRAGKFRFYLKAPNGEIIAASQGYETKSNAEKGIAAIKTFAPGANVRSLS